jgi:hypothetical protein
MDLSDRPEQNQDVAARVIDGTAYLMDAVGGDLHALSAVGTRIHELVDGRRTVTEIVDELEKEYDAERAVLEADALAFLDELEGKGLIRRAPA